MECVIRQAYTKKGRGKRKFIGGAEGMKVATVQHVNGELALLLCPLTFVEMSLFID
jgi:hypothetical protein